MFQGLDYWYDGQIRRYLDMMVLALSGFKWEGGRRNGDAPQQHVTPCRIASRDKQIATIMQNASENTILTVPMITVAMSGLQMRREDLQHPGHISTVQATEREIDPLTQKYTNKPGVRYTVRRMMPRPFNLMIQIDIWTSNMQQKLQLSEQILTVLMPGFDIQNSDNALDWSSATTAMLEDVTWSSRSIPVGQSDDIDIMTINIRIPIWLNPPAEVTQQKLIHQINTNIGYIDSVDDDDFDRFEQQIVTPGNHMVSVQNGTVKLLGENGTDTSVTWDHLLREYGRTSLSSRLHIKTLTDIEDDSGDIIGTFAVDANDPQILNWYIDIDTLPVNTLPPVTAVIDPRKTTPINGDIVPIEGARYLVIENIAPGTQAWGPLSARTNDIIQYVNGSWIVSFDSNNSTATEYVVNQTSGSQMRFSNGEWLMAVDGVYAPGYWRLFLQ